MCSFGWPHNVSRRLVFCYLPGIELHPVFVVYGYSHRTVQTSSEPKPGAMAQVLRYRVPAEWPFCWREPQHRTWRTLGMSQSNPSAALALYSLLGPRATVASVQSGRSDAIVTRGTVPAEWPFCWQVRAARPAQHRTWRPLGLPQSSFGRVHPFRNQGGRSHSCQRAPTYSFTCSCTCHRVTHVCTPIDR